MSKASKYADAIRAVDESLEPDSLHLGCLSAQVSYDCCAVIRTFTPDGDSNEIELHPEYAVAVAQWILKNFGEA